MSYFEFPHTRTYEGDLGYVIGKIIELTNAYNEFFALNKIKFADPIAWDITTQYSPYTIVTDVNTNMAYISKQAVPSGVDILDNDYWEPISSLIVDSQARADIQAILHMFTNSVEAGPLATSTYAVGEYVTVGTDLFKVTAAINIGDSFDSGVNVTPTTVEDMISGSIDLAFSNTSNKAIANSTVTNKFAQVQSDIASVNADVQNAIADANVTKSRVTTLEGEVATNTNDIETETINRQIEDGLLSARIDSIASLPSGSTAGDAELMDIRLSDQNNSYASAGDSVRAQANKNQTTSSFRTYTRSVLANNGWINNSGVNPQSSDSWQYSNAIDISAFANSQIYIYFTATGFNNGSVVVNNIAFFDDNDVFLYGICHPSANVETTYSDTIELPKFAKYMRICSKNDATKPFYVTLFAKNSMIPTDAAGVIRNYINKDIMYINNSDGYLDPAGAFHSAPPATWHASPIKYTRGFNKAYYKLNCNNQVAAIALYREDQSCIRVVTGSSASYAYETGVIDVSEATYIRYCFHADYTDTNFDNHVILFNQEEYNKYSSENYHLVNKPLSFNGKTAVFFGDSITQGVVTPGTVTPNGYPTVFSNMVGLNYQNKGVSGATIYRVAGYPCIYDTVNATDLTGVDYVFLMGGSNDWQLGVTPAQFKSGLNDILGLLTGFTGEIILIAPIDTAGRNPIVTPAADLETFRQIVKEIACTEVLSFVNAKLFDMPTAKSSQAYINEMFGDAIHPSESGYRLIARGLRNALL